MDELLTRIWQDLISRPSGPLSMRFFLQPIMATLLAIRAGARDARSGKPAYLWTLFFSARDQRHELLRSGWADIARIFALALCLDAIFQWIAFRWFYPFEALLIGFALAIVPYALIRGPANRVMTWRLRRKGEIPSKNDREIPPWDQAV